MTSRSDRIAEEKRQKAEDAQRDVDDILEARAEISWLIGSGILEHGPDWTKTWFELDLKWSGGRGSYITIPAVELDEFVERAKANREVFELAKFVTASRIQNGILIPYGLKDLMACYLRGKFTPVSKGPGRTVDTWGRDFIIARTMQILERSWGHRHLTKRDGSSNPTKSISQIVHEGLLETQIGLVDVGRIQKVYTTARKTKQLHEIQTILVAWEFDDDPDLVRI
jgi:hypothetical protein